jgi:predicted dehydrogenase
MRTKRRARPYRVALIGCGDIAETGHLPALLKHPRFRLAALCDVRPERTRLLSRKADGVETVADYRQLLDRKDIDAAILALHPEVSVNVAIDFLRIGKPVLDEKPLACTMENGLCLARVVSETGGVYQIGFVMRYCRLIRRLAETSRQIGAPAFYRVGIFDERLDPANRAHFQRIQQVLRHSSAITHEGSHVIDYFQQWNAAPLVRVHATAVRTQDFFHGPNIWSARFDVADGSVLALEIGWFVPDLPLCPVSMIGPNGTIEVNLRTGFGTIGRRGIRPRRNANIKLEPLTQDWMTQLDVFAEAMDCGKAKIATVRDGLRALTATLACERSQREGVAVKIETTKPVRCES